MIKSDGVEQEVSQEEMEKMKVTLILWNRMTEVEETDEEEERLRKKIKNLKEKLRGQEKVIIDKDKRIFEMDEEIAKRDETIEKQDETIEKQNVVLEKLARKIEELEEKLGGVGVEKRVAGEKPPKYPFPWPQKAGTSGSYRLRLRFTQRFKGSVSR